MHEERGPSIWHLAYFVQVLQKHCGIFDECIERGEGVEK